MDDVPLPAVVPQVPIDATNEHLPKIDLADLRIEHGNLLGSGSYGKVLRAHHSTYGDCAVKIAEDGVKKRENLLRECSMLYKHGQSHPNIIKWFGLYEKGNNLGFVMEFMGCGTLDNLLKLKNLDYKIDHVFSWLRQASDAVNYLHELKLVHRDLKPSNLLLRNDYLILKLCDFGSAVEVRYTMTNCVGSAPYMAPEVFSGKSYGPACDVYSMGIIFWQMITRRQPYNAYGIPLLWNVSNGLRPPPVKCHPVLSQFMERCWSQDQSLRPPMSTVLEFSKIMSDAYPKGSEPLAERNLRRSEPGKISVPGSRVERLSTGRLGHRRTASDEATLCRPSSSGSITPLQTRERGIARQSMSPLTTPISDATNTVSSAATRPSSSSHPSLHSRSVSTDVESETERLLSKVPPDLRPPGHIEDDDLSEQYHNEHIGLCMEWVDLHQTHRERIRAKHLAMREVMKKRELQRLKHKKDFLLSLLHSSLKRASPTKQQ